MASWAFPRRLTCVVTGGDVWGTCSRFRVACREISGHQVASPFSSRHIFYHPLDRAESSISHLYNISHTYTTPRILYPWAHATVSSLLVRLRDLPLRLRESPAHHHHDVTLADSATSCRQGLSIVYDTVSNLSWSVNIQRHSIVNVIENILNKTWLPSEALGQEVPEAKEQEECVVRQLSIDTELID